MASSPKQVIMSIRKSIPNSITSLNLVCGTVAVIMAFRGYELWAIYLILAAAVFDFFDGFAARLLKAYSPMGKELDSLADLVSFGLAPAALIYMRYSELVSSTLSGKIPVLLIEAVSLIPIVLAVGSALRLAKFNVDTRQSESFIGVPTPANAILIISFLHYTVFNPHFFPLEYTLWFWPAISIFLSYLLVSNIPMFSLKMKSLAWKENKTRFIFAAGAIVAAAAVAVTGEKWSLWLILLILTYILYNSSVYIAGRHE